MIRDISGLASPANKELRTGQQSQQSVEQPSSQAPPPKEAAQAAPPEQVKLSQQAQTLKSLEEKLNVLPEVNEERVADIKAKLDSGEFTIDNVALADKMLSSDALFGK